MEPPRQRRPSPRTHNNVMLNGGASRVSSTSKPCGSHSNSDGNNSNYFNSQFANYDTVYNEQYGEPFIQSANCQPVPVAQSGTLGIENGCININLPLAYSYPIDAASKKHATKKKKKCTQQQKCSAAAANTKSCQPNGKPVTIRVGCTSNGAPRFCSTVKSGPSGPACKGYIAKELPACGGNPKGKNKTKMKWDYDAGAKIPIRGVDYGEELYEKAARNLAMQLQKENSLEKQTDGSGTSGRFSATSIFDDHRCSDFSAPSFNSSLKTSVQLSKALEGLKNLPVEIERIFRTDKRFEPIILDKASKALNVNRDSKVFKDLVPVEPNEQVVEQLSKVLLGSVQSVRPPSRARDPEPSLSDFQEVSFSRMKPKAVPSPPKPQSGVSIDVPSSHHIIESQNKLEGEADKM